MSTEPWVQEMLPRSTNRADLLAYFGVPPHPETRLEENIKQKRQFWGKRANGPGGRELAEKVKLDIQNLSLVLLKGSAPDALVVTDEDGRYRIVGLAATVEELISQLAELLRTGDVSGLLKTSRYALSQWPDDPEVTVLIALSLSDIAEDALQLQVEDRHLAITTADAAVSLSPTDERAWLAKARVTAAYGSPEELRAVEHASESVLRTLPPALLGVFIASSMRRGQDPRALQRLVDMVQQSGGDSAIRSTATDLLLNEVIKKSLPIQSAEDVVTFSEIVEVAAWCAEGVPEAELEVLPFRIWAVAARNLVYVGDHSSKALAGVLTGFLALPLVNRLGSQPGWKVLAQGPLHPKTGNAWITMTADGFLEKLHSTAQAGFEWGHHSWGKRGSVWPSVDDIIGHVTSQGV